MNILLFLSMNHLSLRFYFSLSVQLGCIQYTFQDSNNTILV
jgi:hypothetical protein